MLICPLNFRVKAKKTNVLADQHLKVQMTAVRFLLSESGASTARCASLHVSAPPCWCICSQSYKLALSLTKQIKKTFAAMQQTSCKNTFHFFTLSLGLITICLFSLWQAGKQSSFAQNVQITLKHPSSITVQTLPQTRCLQVLGRLVSNIDGGFLTAPPE